MTDAAPGLQQSRRRSNPGASQSWRAGTDDKVEAALHVASSVLVKGRGHSSGVERGGEWRGARVGVGGGGDEFRQVFDRGRARGARKKNSSDRNERAKNKKGLLVDFMVGFACPEKKKMRGVPWRCTHLLRGPSRWPCTHEGSSFATLHLLFRGCRVI